MLKLNSKGISHFLIPLIVVIVGVAAFGTYKLVDSSAASKKPAVAKRGVIKIEGISSRTVYMVKVKKPQSASGASVKIENRTAQYRGNDWYAISVPGKNKHQKRLRVAAKACYSHPSTDVVCKGAVSRIVVFKH